MKFLIGNLLESNAEALVNTVNTVGIMGKGIALQFKERFPTNYKVYKKACKDGTIDIGKILVVNEKMLHDEKWIINFPTKKHWRSTSKIEYIEEGLKDLVQVIDKHQFRSIAIPPLGCGYGGLDWKIVKALIEKYLGDIKTTEIFVYEPNKDIKLEIQSKDTKEVHLTSARAILLYALFHYEQLGENTSLFVANKLAYFLQRLGEELKIEFKASYYGPYSPKVGYVLYHLNGKYITGLEQNSAKPFEILKLNYEKFSEVEEYISKHLNVKQRYRLESLIELISGFESALSLEVLASVDFLCKGKGKTLSLDEVKLGINQWSKRKKNTFKEHHINVAYDHLRLHKEKIG